MQRTIVHMDMDTFFVSCERLKNRELKGIPIIIGGGDRGVVASCSYETRYYGVRSAMPIKMALRLCPEARVIKGDMTYYSKLSRDVTEVIKDKAPIVEKASIDEHYLDITGMDRFFGAFKWTKELGETITHETGLPISFALSINKTVAKIGTGEAKPTGMLQIEPDRVKPFLNPLPIKKIPGIGIKTYEVLNRIGVKRIHDLSEMSADLLSKLIGIRGIEIWKKANGIDHNPVEPYNERKSISNEMTFERDTIDIGKVKELLTGIVERLAFQLRDEQWLTSTVVIKIRYANFDTETKQSRIPYTSADHILSRHVLELFDRLYSRRMRIRLIGVSLTGLVRGNMQISLLDDTEEMVALYQAMDYIRKRFGSDKVGRGSGMLYKRGDF